jgi:S1-C subfamily serine protease
MHAHASNRTQTMKKAPLYSRSRRPAADLPETAPPPADVAPTSSAPAGRWQRLKAFAARHERRLWVASLALLIGAAWFWRAPPGPAPLTFEQIDHLVRKSIEEKPLPSAVTKAYETVLPSVVRVVGLMNPEDDGSSPKANDGKPAEKAPEKAPDKGAPGKEPKGASPPKEGQKEAAKDPSKPMERGVGTGVVIVDNGTILTNLHVVMGAHRIRVTFADGLESEARLINVMPEHDLAVLRALKIPDDLHAATMRSTGDLAPGDHVLAVGFPFGIGPSASSGVVSGLKREFRSPEGERVLTNLIQFDAAANPGNSGGPLVTMEGEVVGIVTAILNPTKQRVFVGIGFAVPIENAASGAGLPPF